MTKSKLPYAFPTLGICGDTSFQEKYYHYEGLVEVRGFSTPGRTSGPPEFCYPPESEFEILDIDLSTCEDEDGNPPSDLAGFYAHICEKHEEELENRFFTMLRRGDFDEPMD